MYSWRSREKAISGFGNQGVNPLLFSGPRFVLNPIRIFKGSFGGPTLYQNPKYVSPNEVSEI
jgi:ribosome biogenesis protein BRX1